MPRKLKKTPDARHSKDSCKECRGTAWADAWTGDGPYARCRDVPCFACDQTGKRRKTIEERIEESIAEVHKRLTKIESTLKIRKRSRP